MLKHKTKLPGLDYFTSGDNPKLLIHSGTHGDESEVTEFVKEALSKYERQLPPFVFVPEVTPSGVVLSTRKNKYGHDMNRDFVTDSSDPEVQANIEIIKNKKFDLFVSFHEDPLEENYYIYDVGYSQYKNSLVLAHNDLIKSMGIGLLNGIDDPNDPNLGYEFVEGYKKFVHPDKYHDDGTISAWVLNRHIADEYLLPEAPGKASRQVKKLIVESFFTEVVLKYFS